MRAILFPGQGAQHPGMGKSFYDSHLIARQTFEEASDTLGYSMQKLCFEEGSEKLRLTEYTQPAILTTSLAIARSLEEPFEAAAGLSLGEYSALVFAGALDFAEALKLVRYRGIYMQQEVPDGQGMMVAVLGLDESKVAQAIAQSEGVVSIANYNTPAQLVLAGERPAVQQASNICRQLGAKKCAELAVSAPFHTVLLKGAADKLLRHLEQADIHELKMPVYANLTAKPYGEVREMLYKQVFSSVRWMQSMQQMVEDGYTTFTEVGPGDALTKFMKRIHSELAIKNIQEV